MFADPSETSQSGLAKLRERLREPQPDKDTPGFLTRIASIITEAFVLLGESPPIVVGGLAVETYTGGNYVTLDIDMVVEDTAAEKRVMSALGFSKRPGVRFYEHPMLDAFIEFPSGPLEGSRDRVSEIRLQDETVLYLIGIEDIIIDRMAAYIHWNSQEDATQAVNLLTAQHSQIDFDYLLKTSEERGLAHALSDILAKAEREKNA